MSLGSRLHNFFSSSPRDPEIHMDRAQAADEGLLTPIHYSVKSRKAAWVAGAMAAFVASSAIFAGVYFQLHQPQPQQVYREFYMTDASGDAFDKVYMGVAKVQVCPERYPLKIVEPSFDILAHQGPSGALLVAAGFVPPCSNPYVRVVFDGAHGCRGDRCQPIQLERQVLKIKAGNKPSVLVDINVAESIHVEAGASPTVKLVPVVAAAFARDPVAYAEWQREEFQTQLATIDQDLPGADFVPESQDTDPIGFNDTTSLPPVPTSGLPRPTETCVLDCADLPTSGIVSSNPPSSRPSNSSYSYASSSSSSPAPSRSGSSSGSWSASPTWTAGSTWTWSPKPSPSQ